jgi:hypothetical protein
MQRIATKYTVSTQKAPAGSRHKELTKVVVQFGPMILAHATLPGKWTSEQARAEFLKNPAKLTFTKDGERYKQLVA